MMKTPLPVKPDDMESAPTTMSREQFEEQVRLHEKMVVDYIWSFQDFRSEAEDTAQDAFLQAWNNLHKLHDETKFAAWVMAIARNIANTNFDTKNRRGGLFSMFAHLKRYTLASQSQELNPETQYMLSDEMAVAERAVDQLPEKLRVIYVLFHKTGLSSFEIAEALDISEPEVRKRLAKAHKTLAQRINRLAIGFLMLPAHRISVFNKVMAEIAILEADSEMAVAATASATVGTATGNTALSGFGVLTLIMFPFLWVMSLFLTGHVYGFDLILRAPTLNVRRWLTRQLLYCYGMAVAIPVLFFAGSSLLTHWIGLDHVHLVVALTGLIPVLLFGLMISWFVYRHQRLCEREIQSPSWDGDQPFPTWKQLGSSIRNIFVITSVLLGAFLTWFAVWVVWPHVHHCFLTGRPLFAWATTIAATGLACIPAALHVGSYRLFRRCYLLSKSEREFRQTYKDDSEETQLSSWLSHKIALALIGGAMLLPSGFQLLIAHKRPLYAGIEFAAFAFGWWWVYKRNQQTTFGAGWLRIVVMFVIQFAILNLLLQTIYV